MERGSAAAGSGVAPARSEEGEEHEGCAGLWELPVERCERRPECGRCRKLVPYRLPSGKGSTLLIVLGTLSTCVFDTVFLIYVAVDF